MFRKIVSLLLMALAPVVARAQIEFTFSGTVTSTAFSDFPLGSAIEIYARLVPSVSSPTGFFGSDNYQWVQEELGEPDYIADVRISGLGGSFVHPVGSATEDMIMLFSDGSFALNTAHDENGDLGLFIGTEAIYNILIQDVFDFGSYLPTFSGELVDPNLVFAGMDGQTFTPTGGQTSYLTTYNGDVQFTLDSMTVTIVPEPSTYALLGGLCAFAVVSYVRRKRA